MLFCPSPPVMMRGGQNETLSSTTGDRRQLNCKDMQKTHLKKDRNHICHRGGTGVNQDGPVSISLCTVYRKGTETALSFLDLVGVLQDTLSLQPAASFFQCPGLYTIISQYQ